MSKYITDIKLVKSVLYKKDGELVEGEPGETLEGFPRPVALKMIRNDLAVLANGKTPKAKKKADTDGEVEEA